MIAAPPAQRMKPLTPMVAIPEKRSEETTGCVVLGKGIVYQGAITELATAYQVRTKNGVVVLPFSEVRTVAPTLKKAYEQLRDSYETPTATDHLDLGNWCEQNQLYEEASAEAQAALVLEPSRKGAISLLKKAEAVLGRATTPDMEKMPAMVPRPAHGVGVVSTETQLQFTRHIQRLALNKCGNGSCHGASALSSFKLMRGTRSEQNLDAILKYVDTENPEMSDLLVKARSADVPHTGLFQGASGAEQYAKLVAWVVQAAEDQNTLAGAPKRPKEWREGGPIVMIRPREKAAEEVPQPGASDNSSPADEVPIVEPVPEPEIETVSGESPIPKPRPSRSPREATLKSEAIRKLLDDQKPDAFDPEEFNRLVHGKSPP